MTFKTFTVSILFCSSILAQLNVQAQQSSKFYPVHFWPIEIQESCEGEAIRTRLNIEYYEEEDVTLTFMGSNNPSLKILFGGTEMIKSSPVIAEEYADLNNLYIQFFIKEDLPNPEFYIKQEINDFSRIDTLAIAKAQYGVSSKNKILNISDACQDSVTLVFGFAGTQTDMILFEYIEGAYQELFSRTYYCCHYGNTYRISKNTNGRYKYGDVGCHTKYSEFEFELR